MNKIVSWMLFGVLAAEIAGVAYLVRTDQVLRVNAGVYSRDAEFYPDTPVSSNGDLYVSAGKSFEPYAFEPSTSPDGVYANDFAKNGALSFLKLNASPEQRVAFSLGGLVACLFWLASVLVRRWRKYAAAMREWQQ